MSDMRRMHLIFSEVFCGQFAKIETIINLPIKMIHLHLMSLDEIDIHEDYA